MTGFEIIKLSLKIVGFGIAGLGAIIEESSTNRKKKIILIIAGIALASIVEFVDTRDKIKESSARETEYKNLLERSTQALKTSQQNLQHTTSVEDRMTESLYKLDSIRDFASILIDSLNKSLSLLSESNSKSTLLVNKSELQLKSLERIISEQTGSVDTPKLKVGVDRNKNILILKITNEAKYTVRSVTVSYFDSIYNSILKKAYKPTYFGDGYSVALAVKDTTFDHIYPNKSKKIQIILPNVLPKNKRKSGIDFKTGKKIARPATSIKYRVRIEWGFNNKADYLIELFSLGEEYIWNKEVVIPSNFNRVAPENQR